MTFAPPDLYDRVVGNIGLFTDHGVLALRCDEPDGVLLSDELGNLVDLNADTGTTVPLTERAWAGNGRRFIQASSRALIAADVAGRDTLTIRDATIQAILSVKLAGAAGAQTVIARGTHDGTADEALSIALEVQASGTAGGIDVRLLWEDYAGAIKTQTAGTYIHPGDDKFVLLTVTRRWEAIDRVVIRYYVADTMIAEVVSADGEIAGSTTGHTMLGGRKSGGGGAWSKFLSGVIDEIVVTDHEMSPEEVRETWRRLTVYQPAGVEMFVGLMPPGAPWYKNPGNNIGRLVKIAGQMLGLAIAGIEELRALFLADAATIETIPRWEHLCGLAPRPRDSLDVRRARVLAYMSRLRGYSLPAIRQAASTVLDQDADDVEILEFTNTVTDDFTTLDEERWLVGSVGAWSAGAGVLSVAQAAGADLRWDPYFNDCHVRMALSGVDGNVFAQCKLAAFWAAPVLPLDTVVGLFLFNRVTLNALWFGVKNVAGIETIGYVTSVAGVLGAFVPLFSPAASAPYWFRVAPPTGGLVGTTYTLSWSTTGPTSGFTGTDVDLGFKDIEWAGCSAMCTAAALATDLAASFDDFIVRTPEGLRPFHWYLYRDTGLPGTPDMIGAQILTQKIKPAHTHAAAITSLSLLCDDPVDGLCDRGPMGGV